ncbi:MAG: iron-containing alcohol dehydrogenase [Clostridia bacterium]|nr:iron-containing alcohol dehydrogenase [Clostridia bacterium]
MNFALKSEIRMIDRFADFVAQYAIGENDLILTNEYVLMPQLEGKEPPCFTIFQEKFGAGEPNDGMIDGVINAIGDRRIDRVFAIGGGTILDIAKLLVYGSGYTCEQLFTKGKELPKVRKLIAVPTTCGTGSEVTGISIAEIRSLHTKMGLATPQLFPDEAVLIPQLLSTLPYGVFAASSIDALIHAIEAYVSINATPYTDVFAREAIERIIPAYRHVVESGKDPAVIARHMPDFLLASNMAGIAFGNAGCGAVHALSYPIGANFHVPHGKANYLLFAACFRMYKKKGAQMEVVENVIAKALGCAVSECWQALETLLDGILDRAPLETFGMTQQHLADFPPTVLATQQRLLKNMPVQLSEEEIRFIYAECMEGK